MPKEKRVLVRVFVLLAMLPFCIAIVFLSGFYVEVKEKEKFEALLQERQEGVVRFETLLVSSKGVSIPATFEIIIDF